MRVIDNASLSEQKDFLAGIERADGHWHATNLAVAGDDGGENIVPLARRVQKILAGKDGAVLLESPDRGMVFVSAAGHDDTSAADACAAAGCDVSFSAVTNETLRAALDRIEEAAGREPRSVLFRHRSRRPGNVMMVVDDDALICAAMKNALNRFGLCVVVHDANDVIDAYVHAAPDCVFLDLHLAGKSGLDAIDEIMAYDKDAHIIMLTADSKASHASAAKARGVKSFVAKPVVLARIEYELFRSPTFRRYAV